MTGISTAFLPLGRPRRIIFLLILLWIGMTMGALFLRPVILAGEQKILSEAWWAWQTLDWFDTRNFGITGIIQLTWLVTGVAEWSARLIIPVIGLLTLWPLVSISRSLWPDEPKLPLIVGIMWFGSGAYVIYTGLISQDLLVVFLVLLLIQNQLALVAGYTNQTYRLIKSFLILFMVFIFSGLYGLVLSLIPVLMASWVHVDRLHMKHKIYLGFTGFLYILAILLGAFIILIAAGNQIWSKYLSIATDIKDALIRDAVMLPFVLFPWLWWPRLWRLFRKQPYFWYQRPIIYMTLSALGVISTIFFLPAQHFSVLAPIVPFLGVVAAKACSLLQDRQRDFHALIPSLFLILFGIIAFLLNMIPLAHVDVVFFEMIGTGLPLWLDGFSWASGFILLGGGYILAQISPRRFMSQISQLAFLPFIWGMAINIEFYFSLNKFFDTQTTAKNIAERQRQGQAIAVMGPYNYQFDLSARLRVPLPALLSVQQAVDWSINNPQGLVIMYYDGGPFLAAVPERVAWGGQYQIIFWSSAKIFATRGAVLNNYR